MEAPFGGRVVLYGTLALVLWAPLPLGSNHLWSQSFATCAAAGLLAYWAIAAALGRVAPPLWPAAAIAPAALLYGAAVLWAAVQVSGLTGAPATEPLWDDVRALAPDIHARIAIAPAAALPQIANLLTYAAVFWLAAVSVRRDGDFRSVLTALAAGGACYAVYGIIAQQSRTILTFEKWAYAEAVTGTFVNRNSFATFAGLALLATAACFLTQTRRPPAQGLPLRARALAWLEQLPSARPAIALAALAIAAALVMTGSRAGVASTLMGGGTMAMVYAASRTPGSRGGARRLWSFAVTAIVAAAIASAGGSLLATRLETGEGLSARFAMWDAVLPALETYGVTGAGLGSFPAIYAEARGEALFGAYTKGHSTYLENALELGVPATLALNAAVVWIAGALLVARRSGAVRALPAALGVGATVLAGVHASVDFSLQIPGVALLFAFVMGACAAQIRAPAPARAPGAEPRFV